MRLTLTSLLASFSIGAFAGQLTSNDEATCEPAGSAYCVGAEYQRNLSQSEARISVEYRRVLKLLPKGYQEHVPSRTDFLALHQSRRSYVQSYCTNYWYFWSGANPWKSAYEVSCKDELNRHYLNFLARLSQCAKDLDCNQLADDSCTPVSCTERPANTTNSAKTP